MEKVKTGDSFMFIDSSQTTHVHSYKVCFSTLIRYWCDVIEKASIIIEPEKVSRFSKKHVKFFLRNIKKVVPISFKVETGENILLSFNALKTVKKRNINECIFTSTAIRCLYDTQRTDYFYLIGVHFCNLCTFFPEEDRGKLFCIANNCYFADKKKKAKSSNYLCFYAHCIAPSHYCKVLTSKEIKTKLKTTKTHDVFRVGENDKVPVQYSVLENTKEEYLKTF